MSADATCSLEEYLEGFRERWIERLIGLTDLPEEIAIAAYENAERAGRAAGRMEALRTAVDCGGSIVKTIQALDTVRAAEQTLLEAEGLEP